MFFDPEVYIKQRVLGFLGILCLTIALSAPMLVTAGEPELPILSAWNKQFGDGRQAIPNIAATGREILEWQQAEDGSFSLVRRSTAFQFSQFTMEEGMTLSSLMRDHQWRVRVARNLRQD